MSTLTYTANKSNRENSSMNEVYSKIHKITSRIRESITNGNFESLKFEVWENYHESQQTDCNNYFDEPIDFVNVDNLLLILNSSQLPLNCKPPEIFADPRGFIGLEWISKDNDRLVIVPKKRHSLIYAYSIGNIKEHGEVSIYSGVPKKIIEKIENYFSK
jgi:hypothetical protein